MATFNKAAVEQHIAADAAMGRSWHSPQGCGCANCRVARAGVSIAQQIKARKTLLFRASLVQRLADGETITEGAYSLYCDGQAAVTRRITRADLNAARRSVITIGGRHMLRCMNALRAQGYEVIWTGESKMMLKYTGKVVVSEAIVGVPCEYCAAIGEATGRTHCPIHSEAVLNG